MEKIYLFDIKKEKKIKAEQRIKKCVNLVSIFLIVVSFCFLFWNNIWKGKDYKSLRSVDGMPCDNESITNVEDNVLCASILIIDITDLKITGDICVFNKACLTNQTEYKWQATEKRYELCSSQKAYLNEESASLIAKDNTDIVLSVSQSYQLDSKTYTISGGSPISIQSFELDVSRAGWDINKFPNDSKLFDLTLHIGRDVPVIDYCHKDNVYKLSDFLPYEDKYKLGQPTMIRFIPSDKVVSVDSNKSADEEDATELYPASVMEGNIIKCVFSERRSMLQRIACFCYYLYFYCMSMLSFVVAFSKRSFGITIALLASTFALIPLKPILISPIATTMIDMDIIGYILFGTSLVLSIVVFCFRKTK